MKLAALLLLVVLALPCVLSAGASASALQAARLRSGAKAALAAKEAKDAKEEPDEAPAEGEAAEGGEEGGEESAEGAEGEAAEGEEGAGEEEVHEPPTKQLRPLPEQGFHTPARDGSKKYGEHVQHKKDETATEDWLRERHLRSAREICADHPNSKWCRLNGFASALQAARLRKSVEEPEEPTAEGDEAAAEGGEEGAEEDAPAEGEEEGAGEAEEEVHEPPTKQLRPLPEQGFHTPARDGSKKYGEHVQHKKDETVTEDWLGERHLRSAREICADHPNSKWCRLNGFH